MSISDCGSVTQWVERLRAGDRDAAGHLWQRYFPRLVALARARLAGPRPEGDGEDVALSALDHFCREAAADRLPGVENRDDLWRVLAALAVRGVIDRRRHDRAGKRDSQRRADESELADIPDTGVPPEVAVAVAEEVGALLARLNDAELQAIAVLKLEGHTNEEIADRLGCVPRTVARRLRVIRSLWAEGGDGR